MRKHTMDIVLSISLFMLFVVCSFLLILFQINGYHKLQYDADNLYTLSSYIQTEARQNDRIDTIEVQTIQGKECLVIHHTEGISYFYIKDGYLMQLYQDEEMQVNFNLGNKRFQLDSWQLDRQEQMIHISLQKGSEATNISLRIKSGGHIL